MNGRGEELGVPYTDGAPYAQGGAHTDGASHEDGSASPRLPAGVRPMPGDPQYIGGYRVLGRLGEGGMGVVHLGQAPDGRLVAVKVVASRYARDEEFLLRFRHEGEHARRVPRFCTAEVLDVDVTAQPPYLVTEYIDGPTLTEAVRSGGPLRKAELDQLAVAMATALSAIHGVGLVHRDLKPGNVLLSRMGPRVIDFGIARSLETPAGLTATGMVLGTGSYMAPEQHMGDGVTPASDVFAWGGVMAFAASGRAPFGNGPPHAIAYRVVHGEPDVAPLDPPLRDAVSAALRKEPAGRPTVGQLLQLLGVPGGGMPVHHQRPVVAPAPPLSPPWPTHPPAAPVPAGRAKPAGARRRLPIFVALAVVVVAALAIGVGPVLARFGSDHSGDSGPATTNTATTAGAVGAPDTANTAPAGSPGLAAGSLNGHWIGTWGTGDRDHYVAVDGTNFRMIYDLDDGRVAGTLRDGMVDGRWAEGPLGAPPVRSGWVRFRIVQDGTTIRLDGLWGNDPGVTSGTWQIRRVDGTFTREAVVRFARRGSFPAPPP